MPSDPVNLCVETIDMAGASSNLICAAVYARFKRKNDSYSCQLVFARLKLVPKDMSMQRTELMAASLNVSTVSS